MTCKECKHWHLLSDGLLTLGVCTVGNVMTTDLTECRYAERKEEAGDVRPGDCDESDV